MKYIPEEDPKVQRAGKYLMHRLAKLTMGQDFTQQLFSEACEVVRDHRKECIKLGVQFPKLMCIPLVSQKAIEVVRCDMDIHGVKNTLLNFTVKYPNITPQEIADIAKKAFPDYVRNINPEARTETKRSSITI